MNEQSNRKKILIIEKEYIVAYDLMQALKHEGHEVFFKSNYEVALTCIERQRPDLILADTVTLKEAERFSHEKDQMIVMSKDLKALAFFDKPFRSEMLVKWLSDYLSRQG
jgi:DNA-binding NtrC family response regulator